MDVNKLSYTEFIGFINQTNVPPGSFDTLNRWRVYSNLCENSNLLEIACTTGFSSRELSVLTGCMAHGIDISEDSISTAKNESPSPSITYEVANGVTFKGKSKYSHIVIGASLSFFENPYKLLDNVKNNIMDGGYLLACPFYVKKEIPNDLIKKAKGIFGINITTSNYKDIMSMYKDFEIHYIEKKKIDKETEQEIHHYCQSTIDRFKDKNPGVSNFILKESYKRLEAIKRMSNDLRPYQEYVVLVLKHIQSKSGKRFVELF